MIGRSYFNGTMLCCLLGSWLQGVDCRAQSRQALTEAREQMVDKEIVAAGVRDPRVIRAMRTTPRHEFVSLAQRPYAYFDMALPIGESQTISPPFVVAYMTELLQPKPTDKVLEIGTGSGYQAAVLSGLVGEVYTIEIVPSLGRRAARTLTRLKYDNVHAKIGDGFQGWPEHAPFDKIIVTCSPESVPQPLTAQLKEGGRMVIPVGERYNQTIHLLTKKDGKMVVETLRPTLFVPMTGQAEEDRKVLPDPANPSINNGGFEQVAGEEPAPMGWHYQRQLELVSDGGAPEGKNYVTFRNAQAGRGSHALQGLGVDGRQVRRLEVSFRVRGREIRPGQNSRQLPVLAITFYDENRATIGLPRFLGPWRGTFPWQAEAKQIEVPGRAREAIVRIGLMGAVGEVSFDDVRLGAAAK